MIRRKKMRTKNFLIFLVLIIFTGLLFIILGPATEQNDSLKNIVTQTHQQIKVLQENLRNSREKSLEIDEKYLEILGFKPIPTVPNDMTTRNFSVVTYVQAGQLDTAVLYAQNIQTKLPNVSLLIYDLGLSEDDLRTLTGNFCNNSKCSVIPFDLTPYPNFVNDDRMHAYRPLIIKNALMYSRVILFTENDVRIRSNVTAKDVNLFKEKTEKNGTLGVLGWTTTKQAISSRTHPKMFEYFNTNPDSFYFLPMISINAVFFIRTPQVINSIMLPWIKCVLTQECLHPIGAQSGGCKYNKKPQYRYSGCHGYDESAFSIVLGLTSNFDETKYSIPGDAPLFSTETLEQSTKILENRRKNISDASERPYTES